jgi:hypothetical protein
MVRYRFLVALVSEMFDSHDRIKGARVASDLTVANGEVAFRRELMGYDW